MTLLQLSYFVALAENLHYTKTAEQLHISQPSLSYAISGMEKDLGVKLFVKDRQGVALSQFGKEYYPYAKRALDSLESGRRIVTAMTHYADTVVRLGYFHSIAASLVPALIHSVNDTPESSNIRFQLIEDSVQRLMADLYSGELDLCFSSHPESWAHSIPVARQPLYLAVSAGHPLAQKTAVRFSDFAAQPQIMLTRGSDLRTQIEQLFQDHGVVPRTAYETRECNAALQYVALDFGVSILPQVPVMDHDSITILPILLEDGRELSRAVYLTYHKTRPLAPAAQYVADHARERLSAAL